MGRAPTPNVVLLARGSKKARKNEPVLQGGFGKPPPTLNAIGIKAWIETAKELEAIGIGSLVERTALECYCRAVQEAHAAYEEIDANGAVIDGAYGKSRNPACLNMSAAWGHILKFAIQFGLTPASRSKLTGTSKDIPNEFEGL